MMDLETIQYLLERVVVVRKEAEQLGLRMYPNMAAKFWGTLGEIESILRAEEASANNEFLMAHMTKEDYENKVEPTWPPD